MEELADVVEVVEFSEIVEAIKLPSIPIFPDKTVTARAAESRMGSGKGAVDYWVAIVKPGTILFEIDGVPEDVAKNAFNLASYKLPIKTKFIVKNNI